MWTSVTGDVFFVAGSQTSAKRVLTKKNKEQAMKFVIDFDISPMCLRGLYSGYLLNLAKLKNKFEKSLIIKTNHPLKIGRFLKRRN